MKHIVCIGGGHGLANLLKLLKQKGIKATGIVSTTDNGGSTGSIKDQFDTIGWGDLRHCLQSLSNLSSVPKLLFEHRFQSDGDLNNHSLGNLMLLALNSMCATPTDAALVMQELLQVDTRVLPMSNGNGQLCAKDIEGNTFEGEVSVDTMKTQLASIWTAPQLEPSSQVIGEIESADHIILAPGSFVTSILPALTMPTLVTAINRQCANLICIHNAVDDNTKLNDKLTSDEKQTIFSRLGVELEVVFVNSPEQAADDDPLADPIEMRYHQHFSKHLVPLLN